ncbi:MAG TPA: tRNA (adenosine(37)-N6)-threonylcarbamoyltransferase complex dimerization subunit type 1 TsaB [Rhabdochlamydiaceae bacterium]|nr:tRNA (adenosine(37)-N6)-threonylcarbamoyltransferase complex dimerization subunit type 1 TsaB [Rhabdochlamydiaceae bacterium]
MKGLTIETSTSSALVSVTDQKKVINFTIIEPAQNLSKDLLPSIKQLLLEGGLELKNLAYVAVGIGPGAYTGVRVGAIVGKSLAYSLNIPLIGFESPLAFLPENRCGTFAFLADAKMGQFYLLKGTKTSDTATLQFPAQLIDNDKLNSADITADFLIAPPVCGLNNALSPALNPFLIASIAFERFSTHSPYEFKLIYYR